MRNRTQGDRSGWRTFGSRSGFTFQGPSDPSHGLVIGGDPDSNLNTLQPRYISAVAFYASPKLVLNPQNGAFRAGLIRVFGTEQTQWNTENQGVGSAAFGMSTRATGELSFSAGHANLASGQYSVALGQGSTASGVNSFAAAASVASNLQAAAVAGSTASAQNAFAGAGATASNTLAFAGAGGNASGINSVSLGLGCTSTANTGVSIGSTCTASQQAATAIGFASVASRWGQLAHSGGKFAANGDAQHSEHVLLVSTTDATATEVIYGDATTYLTIPASRTMSFHIKIAAHRTDVSGTAAAWPLITGAITRDSSGNCRLLGSVTGAGTTTMADAGGLTWSIGVTADTANNRLAIAVTGEAAKTIRWVATVQLTEVG